MRSQFMLFGQVSKKKSSQAVRRQGCIKLRKVALLYRSKAASLETASRDLPPACRR
jgi:hypothetical protein